MQLLTRYLLFQFIRYFITLNVAFSSLYLLIDFFEKFDEFSEAGKPLSLVFGFFILNLPYVVDQLSPVLILLSGVITLGILNNNNELLALKAAGIPLRKIIRPVLIGSGAATVLFIVAAQLLLPRTIAVTNDIWFEQVRGKVPLGIYRNGRYYFKGREGFYSFQWPNKEKMIFKDFSYSTWDDNYNIRLVASAQFANWAPPIWVLKKGQIIERDDSGSFVSKPFRIFSQRLPETPDDFLVPEYESAEMSLTGLFSNIGKQDLASERTRAQAEFYGRISYLLLGIPLLLLGLPVLIISYQRWGRDLSIAIPVSCFMAFIAWGIWGTLQSLARTEILWPLPAAFAVNILFALVGIYLLQKQDM